MINSSFATDNTIHKTINKSTRILYDPNNTLFDLIINDLNLEIYYDNAQSVLDKPYDLYISNNFLKHSMNKNNFLFSYHLLDLLFIHEPLHQKFKKEDKIILNNNLKNTTKILLHDSLNESWNNFDNKEIIRYGIKTPDIDLSKSRDDILIINLTKSNQLNLIYQHLKNIFPKTTMITDIANDWDSIYTTISSYKVVIDESSIFHQLIAAYCGCIIITPNIHFDKKIIGYFNIENFGLIFNSMNSILESYDSKQFVAQSEYIKDNYQFDIFKNNIVNIIQVIKEKIFIL